MDNNKRAEILIQAMPYIQKNYGKTVVVKYGGNAMQSDELKQAVMDDIVLMQLVGINVVLVHGGGPEINEMLVKTGKKSEFKNGLRVTDKETIDIVQQVLAGRVNKSLVQHLTQSGGRAIGLCGLDGKMLMASKLESEDDLGFVGEIESVNPLIIMDSLKNGYIPVISTIAGGKNGEVYNINADLAAARIAAKLSAKKLILMTDVRGLLRDVHDDESLISTVCVSDVPSLKKEGIIQGGMIPKIDCCVEAVRSGVSRAHIIDGRLKHSILLELFSDEGIGTMLY
ncbi:MAG: acetylglutamate kinase [Ruminococcus sp.]|nr:acetylglutamate kinase [Ruminococcus sp.]